MIIRPSNLWPIIAFCANDAMPKTGELSAHVPVCNMDGCTQPSVSFMASTLPERKRKVVDELHLGGTGIGETGIEPGVD
jgi:hypothetical protein